MATPAEGLSAESSDEDIKAAIAATISMLVDEGFSQEQAVAIATGMARKATGKEEQRSGVRRAS